MADLSTVVATLPPLPTLPPMPAMPTIPPITLPPALASLAPTLPPVLSSLAPIAATALPLLTTPGAIGSIVSNVTKAVKVITDAAPNVTKAAQTAADTITATGAPKAVPKPKPKEQSLADLLKPFIIPTIALILGAVMMANPAVSMWGKLVLYFGAQSFMNIFMSWVLGTHVTLPQGTVLANGYTLQSDLRGCPAGFALTALQQVVSFILFLIYFVVMKIAGTPYEPKKLTDNFQYISVVIFGCVFAGNIALNNFSLGYISISVNLIIRSCLPLSTYLSQQLLANAGYYEKKAFKIVEVSLMCIGVICACIFTWADNQGKLQGSQLIGVLACVGSLLCGSLNLALAGVLGDKSVKLNVLDTVAYMSVPATMFLLPIIFFIAKPVPNEWRFVGAEAPADGNWNNVGEVWLSDGSILYYTWVYSKSTGAWLLLSGVLSFMYNLCQFNIVHTLSPSATAFGGNFNKAALTFMTLLLPFLQTKPNPPQPYYGWEWFALILNIVAFSYYSYLQIQEKAAKDKQPPHKELEESDEETGSTGSE